MIVLNEDKEHVLKIKKALEESNGYCPCSLIKDEDHKCMCKDFRESREEGLCHCGLYLRKNM